MPNNSKHARMYGRTSQSAKEMSANDSGSASVEMVLLAPVLVLLMLFVVFLGRAGGASDQIRHAADEASRAASLVARPRMHAVAQAVAAADLSNNGFNCQSTSVAVVVSEVATVSSITVTVSCRVNQEGTALVGSNARVLVASSTEIIDRYRAR